MTTHLERLIERRNLVRAIVRGVVAALVLAAVVPIVREFLSRIPYGWGTFLQRPIFTFRAELIWAGTCLFAAVVLFVVQRRLARWIVPLDRGRCPECDYRVEGSAVPRCPECGLALPEWIRHPDGDP